MVLKRALIALSMIGPRLAIGGAVVVSIFALGSALFIEHIMGLPPCDFCIWQRWPYVGAVLFGIAVYSFKSHLNERHWSMAAIASGLMVGLSGDIGLYHVGIEQGWWAGTSGCTAKPISGLSTSEALEAIMSAPVVRCDDIAFKFLGLSLATWNVLFSWATAIKVVTIGVRHLKAQPH